MNLGSIKALKELEKGTEVGLGLRDFGVFGVWDLGAGRISKVDPSKKAKAESRKSKPPKALFPETPIFLNFQEYTLNLIRVPVVI